MNIPIWIKSEYVTYIGIPSFLLIGGIFPSFGGGEPPRFGFPYPYYISFFYRFQPVSCLSTAWRTRKIIVYLLHAKLRKGTPQFPLVKHRKRNPCPVPEMR